MSMQSQSRMAGISNSLVTNSKLVFLESIGLVIALWWATANVLGLQETISSPELVAMFIIGLFESGIWWEHLFDTFRRVIYGFSLTMLLGTVIGVMMGMSKFWEKVLQDYVTVGLALPSLFAAVFAAMWFGVSDITPMVAAAAISFPFVAQEVYEAVKDIDNDLLQMSSSFNISQKRSIRRVIVQSVLPQWFGGARYGFASSWKIVTLAELVAAQTGIGFMIQFEMKRLSITGVLGWTILFTIVMLVLEYGLLRQIEQRMFDWRDSETIGWG
ncbi:ABC transporter permease [Halorarius halobius]|uniref:ABC transporter permease n=1 Tax=Halorarius halobius TaxID=2962671 RepID=UPI0020CE1FC9|nr:ABC transporter permease subunit [Halorarius halobius]